jgi:hypothetical protein
MSKIDMPASPRPPLTRGGLAMVIIGLLILVPSGLCTGFFGITSVISLLGNVKGEGRYYAEGILEAALVIGVGPITIGAILLIIGLRRRERPEA